MCVFAVNKSVTGATKVQETNTTGWTITSAKWLQVAT